MGDSRTYPPGYTGAEKRWHDFLDAVCDGLRTIAKDVPQLPAYWDDDDGSGEYFCGDCAPAGAAGGFDIECDSSERCEKCGRVLDVNLTDYGVREEMSYATDADAMASFVGAEESFVLLNIIQCGVPRLTERCGEFTYRADMKPLVRRIAKRVNRTIEAMAGKN